MGQGVHYVAAVPDIRKTDKMFPCCNISLHTSFVLDSELLKYRVEVSVNFGSIIQRWSIVGSKEQVFLSISSILLVLMCTPGKNN